jgi:hypothetical protein
MLHEYRPRAEASSAAQRAPLFLRNRQPGGRSSKTVKRRKISAPSGR